MSSDLSFDALVPLGWDDRVAEALGLARRERTRVNQHVQDIGP